MGNMKIRKHESSFDLGVFSMSRSRSRTRIGTICLTQSRIYAMEKKRFCVVFGWSFRPMVVDLSLEYVCTYNIRESLASTSRVKDKMVVSIFGSLLSFRLAGFKFHTFSFLLCVQLTPYRSERNHHIQNDSWQNIK